MSVTSPGPTADFYVLPPTDDPDQVLWLVTLDAVDGDEVSGTFTEDAHRLEPEATVNVYYSVKGEFMKQPSEVIPTADDAGPDAVRLRLRGEPVSANNRQAFRVSCVGCDITVTLGQEANCDVVDLSATGFGTYATQSLRIGDIVDAELHYQGQVYRGQVAVQSVRRMVDKVRYGVCVVDSPSGHSLVKALPQVNAAVQREQLRRLA